MVSDDPMLKPVPPPKNILKDWRTGLQEIRNRSPDYIRAQSQVEVARGQSRIALSKMLPKLDANGRVNHHLITEAATGAGAGIFDRIPDPQSSWSAGGTLKVPILAARNWYDYATSRDVIAQTALSAENAERLIIGGLAESIVTVITAERLSEVTRVNLRAALSNLQLNARRAQLGSGSAVGVLRARQEVASSRAQVIEADETLRKSREALGLALGYSEAWGVRPDLKLDELRQDARDTCTLSSGVGDRADVRAAAAGAAIATRNVNSVMYAYLPTIEFNSVLNHNSYEYFASPATTWTIGGTLTWRLYDGGLRYGQKQTNEAILDQRNQDSIQVEREANLEVTQSQRGVLVAQASLSIAKESREIAKDNAQLARVKFLNGTGTSFDMVDTQSTARRTDLDVTVKEFQLLRAQIISFLALATCEI